MNLFSVDMLKLNCEEELDKIATAISDIIFKQFKKRGAVVALSGGIDSSVVCALCSHALACTAARPMGSNGGGS